MVLILPFIVVFADEKQIHYRSTWIPIIVSQSCEYPLSTDWRLTDGHLVVVGASFFLRYIMSRENKQRDFAATPLTPRSMEETKDTDAQTVSGSEKFDFEDLTDWQRKEFRYVL
jgi:hypothetical protein